MVLREVCQFGIHFALTGNMDKKHLLLVDKDKNLLNTFAFLLKAAGYKVTTATNGQDALKTISAGSIDLLITDIRMSGLSGQKLIDELNRLGVKIPVVVITGFGNHKPTAELKRKGCAAYFEKPFNEEVFVRRIGSILEKSAPGSCGGNDV